MPGVKLATAYYELIPSMAGSQAAITQQMGAAGAAGSKSFSQRFKAGLGGGGASSLAAAAAGAFTVKFLKDSVGAASDLSESVNAVKVSYGAAAKDVLALGKNSATSFGLGQSTLNDFAVRFSGFSKQIAGPNGDVAASFEKVLGRATDFASVMNLEVGQAAELFQSGLAGESEPLRKFGIDLSAAKVEAFAYANGIAETGAKLTESQKVQARYGTLMEQTSKVQGDFKNTSGGLANQQRIMAATFDKVKIALGNALLPALQAVTPLFVSLFTFIAAHKSVMAVIAIAIGIILVAALYAAATAAWAFTVALLANPMVWIIVGIIALVAAIVLLVRNWDLVKEKTAEVWDAIKTKLAGVWDSIKAKAAELWQSLKDTISDAWDKIKATVVEKGQAVLDWFKEMPGKLLAFWVGANMMLIDVGVDLITGLWNGIKSMGAWLKGKIIAWAKENIPGPFLEALGITSPSKVMADQVGKMIPAGIVMGIEQNASSVQDAIGRLTSDLTLAELRTTARLTAPPSAAAGVVDRPIRMPDGTLFGWVRDIASDEATLVLNKEIFAAATV
jgi:phage-related protein